MSDLHELCSGLPLRPLPENRGRWAGVPHAPVRTPGLTPAEEELALRNALRYFPADAHAQLAPEFARELRDFGHVYMYRLCPRRPPRACPIEQYPCRTKAAAAIMHMIMNNLDPEVAQFPQELVTYGGNGQVFSNWAQFRLTMSYLAKMTEEQTLVMYSGHPLGLFPSSPSAPRLVVTNGMVVPNYSSKEEYEKLFALGVTMYGQMTAGSYCYIGPQGIVHGTVLTLLNAARRYLGVQDLAGKVFVTSGLGGMSGAQAKAAVIVGCVGVIAEVDKAALDKRHKQGWLMEVTDSLDRCIERLRPVPAGADVGKTGAGKTDFRYPSYVQDIMGGPQHCAEPPPCALPRVRGPASALRAASGSRLPAAARDEGSVVPAPAGPRVCLGWGRGFPVDGRGFPVDGRGFPVQPGAWLPHDDRRGPPRTSATPFRVGPRPGDGGGHPATPCASSCRGEVINGGFGLVLDGTAEAEQKARMMLSWDVSNGVARRCWSGNQKAYETIWRTMEDDSRLEVTLPHEVADDGVIRRALRP
nr:urocanate hydratase-like [Microcebus murinus]